MRTPLRRSAWLSRVTGADVWLKLETLQPTFSYKIRGAFNAVTRLVEEGNARRAPLVTASAGNHGRALAYAAHAAGIPLTVYVPINAPRTKIDAIRALGADLRTCADYDTAEAEAKAHGRDGRALFISPYSHPDIIAGAGTVGLEILEDSAGVDTIVVPVGGGGLISGVALAAEGAERNVAVIGVEVEASHPFTTGLAAGRIVEVDVQPTLADGLAGNLDPDTMTFAIVSRLVRRIALVCETDLAAAIRGVVLLERLVAEGAGAAGVAAALAGQLEGRWIAIVLSGANIDGDTLKGLL